MLAAKTASAPPSRTPADKCDKLPTPPEAITGTSTAFNKKKIENLSESVKSHVAKKIEKKKTEIRKLQELYQNPESIPNEVKMQIAKQIREKKIELKNIYSSPKDIFTLERVGKWGIIQIVKVFFGMPFIPGR